MDWLKDIVLFSAVMGVIEWILPRGVYEKYIKYVISVLTLAVILAPLAKAPAIAVGLELPVGAIAQDSDPESQPETSSLESIQIDQVQNLVQQKVKKEVHTLLKDKVSGISEDDIEVYIDHDPLDHERTGTFLIVIETSEMDRSREIRSMVKETLRLSNAEITVKGK